MFSFRKSICQVALHRPLCKTEEISFFVKKKVSSVVPKRSQKFRKFLKWTAIFGGCTSLGGTAVYLTMDSKSQRKVKVVSGGIQRFIRLV